MKILITTLLSIFIFSLAAFAAEWTEIKAKEDKTFYINESSIEKKGDVSNFWYKVDLSKNTKISSIKEYVSLNCNERLFKTLESVSYDLKGNLIERKVATDSFEPIPPDSTIDNFYYKVCSVDNKDVELPSVRLYLADVKKTVYANWQMPSFDSKEKSTYNVKISKEGIIESANISETNGSIAFNNSILDAFNRTSSFSPMPKSYKEDFKEFNMVFDALTFVTFSTK
ncbi:MAG: surface-adhesin E family protein [bacterium]